MKPGTPLPWWEESGIIHAKGPLWTPENHSCVHPGSFPHIDDAEYAVHTANLYPKLVGALKSCHALAAHYGPKGDEYLVREVLAARDLLAECGDQ